MAITVGHRSGYTDFDFRYPATWENCGCIVSAFGIYTALGESLCRFARWAYQPNEYCTGVEWLAAFLDLK